MYIIKTSNNMDNKLPLFCILSKILTNDTLHYTLKLISFDFLLRIGQCFPFTALEVGTWESI